jgi:hypothetical protein
MSVALSKPSYPEPVPGATQLAALPFLAAVDGYLRRRAPEAQSLRITLHRVMSRDGDGYLQQVTAYLGSLEYRSANAGRVFAVTTGIIGRAYRDKRVVRTRRYDTEFNLMSDLTADLEDTGQAKEDLSKTVTTFLAVPFLFGSDDEVVAILFADARAFNLFSDDEVVHAIMAQCDGFCRALDELISSPLPGIRNYRLQQGKDVTESETAFPRLQETIDLRPVPRFQRLRSFNFEAAE